MLPAAAIYGQLAAQNHLDPLLQAALAQSAVSSQTPSSTESAATGSKDTMFTKIFVGGLPYHTTDKTLHDYFAQFGDIEEAVVITDRQTQKSRGYGFVTMKDRADAEKATRDPNPIIDGRKANVNLAYLGAKPRNNVQLAGECRVSCTASLTEFPERLDFTFLGASVSSRRLNFGLNLVFQPSRHSSCRSRHSSRQPCFRRRQDVSGMLDEEARPSRTKQAAN